MADPIKSFSEYHSSIDTVHVKSNWRRMLAFLGPAYLVSVGYMDPGNWATDIAAGSQFGYALIWVIVLSNFTAILLQSHSARLGLVTGKDIAQFSRTYYPRYLNFIYWIFAEIAIAATDLAEVLGMAIGLKLLLGLNMLLGVTLSLFDTFIIMFLVRRGMRMLEAIIIGLVSVIGISFLLELLLSKPSVSEIFTGFIPSLPGSGSLYIAIGIIGATVMPHNLYLHSSIVQTRKYATDKKGLKRAIRFNILDTSIALNLALFVNAAILILAASAFYTTGHTEITDIMDAHRMLQPLLGTVLAPVLFAVALIASGQSSTLTGTITGQIVMEGYLNLRIEPWLRRLITRSIAVIPAFITIWIAGESMSGSLLILSQVILSLQLGFAIVPLVHWVSSKRIMGDFRINIPVRFISWLAVGVIIVLNVKLVVDTMAELLRISIHPMLVYILILVPVSGAFLLLLYTIVEPVIKFRIPLTLAPAHHDPGALILEKPMAYKRIAVSIDFSEADNHAINAAISQGGKDAEYFLIHIVESAGARMMRSDISDSETSDDRVFLERYAQQLTDANYSCKTIIDFGLAGNVIPQVIKKIDAHLLVMSSHRKGGLHRFFKGRTISAVQKRVNIPLIILK
jgi:manganese transport protein